MQLWLCLRLHELAVQCLPQRRPQPLAVVERQRVYAVNAAASLLGLEPGMDLASARALAGENPVQMLPRDPDAEKEAIDSLCCWAYGITPHLYEFRGDCLMLEISGSLRLFGGADAILRQCTQGLACRGFNAEHAFAESPLAAWALSFTEDQSSEGTDRALRERLNPLPLQLLEPLHEEFGALQRSGFQHLADILALEPAALSRRCGHEFSELLQHLCATLSNPVVHFDPPSCFTDSFPLGYPVTNHEELAPAFEQLLESLDRYLRQRQLQTRQLRWLFYGAGGYRENLEVGASEPGSRPEEWLRLTQLRLERKPFSDEVERVQLQVVQLENAQPQSGSLFRTTGPSGTPAQLVDLLSSRLGSQAVSSLRCRDAHLPEHSSAAVAPGIADNPAPTASAQRPFWLLPTPEPLRYEGDRLYFWGQRLELLYGPERIEDGWWEAATSRDYFIARNSQEERFWVFHERRQRSWFIHGFFA